MSKVTKTVTVGGKSYDYENLAEVSQLQGILVPENWPGTKRDGVKLFLNLQEMLGQEFKRHLAHNFRQIAKTALEEKADQNPPKVGISFSAEIDLSALQVAAHGKTKMSYSRKFSTEGKAKAHDINQTEFLGEDMSVILNTSTLDEEMAAPSQAEIAADAKKEEKAKSAAAKGGKKTDKPKPAAKG